MSDSHSKNLALAYEHDAFNDPEIKRLGLCPVCLVDLPDCNCKYQVHQKQEAVPKFSGLWVLALAAGMFIGMMALGAFATLTMGPQ